MAEGKRFKSVDIREDFLKSESQISVHTNVRLIDLDLLGVLEIESYLKIPAICQTTADVHFAWYLSNRFSFELCQNRDLRGSKDLRQVSET